MKRLGEVCEIRPPKKIAKEKIGMDEVVSFVPMGYLPINEKYFSSPETKPLNKAYSGYVYFENNDVILAKITPCFENGKLGIAKNLKNGIGFGSSEFIVYRASSHLIPEFLYYYLSQESFRKVGESLMSGAVGHKRIPKEFYEQFQIPLPPLSEQQAIVARLDAAFAQIDQAQANLKRNIDNAKELFQSKLNAIFSQRGAGWEERKLGEVCDLHQGLAINAKTKHLLVEKSNLPLLRIKDLRNNTEEQYVKESGFPANALVTENEIIYTRTGNSLGLVFRGRKGVLHNNSFKIIPERILSNDYLYWWLQHDAFKSRIIELASKAAQPDITHKIFKEQLITIPSLELQEKHFNNIEQLNKLIKSLLNTYMQELTALNELKKSLLQKAFAGELV